MKKEYKGYWKYKNKKNYLTYLKKHNYPRKDRHWFKNKPFGSYWDK